MGKSKAQRKQDKKISMQEVKKEQEIKVVEEETKYEEQSVEEKTPVKKPVGPEQVKLTMYTLISMIVTFVSAGVVAVAMVVYAKPVIYVLKVTVGAALKSASNDYTLEAIEQLMYEDTPDLKIYGLYLGVAVLLIVAAVVTLVGMIKAVDEFNKPNIALTIIGFVFAVAALVLFLYTDDYTKDAIRRYGFPEEPEFGLYSLYLPLLITNIVAMICNIIATVNGLSRWKKTGRTSK